MIGILTPMNKIDCVSIRNVPETILYIWPAHRSMSCQDREGSHKLLKMDAILEIMNVYYRMGGLV